MFDWDNLSCSVSLLIDQTKFSAIKAEAIKMSGTYDLMI